MTSKQNERNEEALTRIEDIVTKLHEGIMNDGRNKNHPNLGSELAGLSKAFGKSLLDESNTEEEHNIWCSLCRTYVELRQPDVTVERAAFLQSQIPSLLDKTEVDTEHENLEMLCPDFQIAVASAEEPQIKAWKHSQWTTEKWLAFKEKFPFLTAREGNKGLKIVDLLAQWHRLAKDIRKMGLETTFITISGSCIHVPLSDTFSSFSELSTRLKESADTDGFPTIHAGLKQQIHGLIMETTQKCYTLMVLIFALPPFRLDEALHTDPHEIDAVKLLMVSHFGLALGDIGKRVDKLTADIIISTYRAQIPMA